MLLFFVVVFVAVVVVVTVCVQAHYNFRNQPMETFDFVERFETLVCSARFVFSW